jgi:hypothetical protein
MEINTDNYKILYADAPFLKYDKNACISTNLQLSEGDSIASVNFIPGGVNNEDDVLNFTLNTSDGTNPAVLIQAIQTISPTSKDITIQLSIAGQVVVSQSVEYGKGVLHADIAQVHVVDYIAAPYINKDNTGTLKSACVIINLPVYETDHVSFSSFETIPDREEDVLTIQVSSKNDSKEPTKTYAQLFGPFMLSNKLSSGVVVQVSVNNQAPVKSPLGKKSYGQDELSRPVLPVVPGKQSA